MAFEIARAGWLHRESSFLKRWKKNWFVLYTDGYLKYFESEDSHMAEDTGLMPAHCTHIKTGSQIQNVNPPEGSGRSCLITVVFRDKTWNLCAESPDDMSAWKMVLDDARIISMAGGPQYGDTPPSYTQVISEGVPGQPEMVTYVQPNNQPYVLSNGQAYIPGYGQHQHQGNTTIIVREDRRNDEMANGMLAGAMVGTAMWMPLLWW